jgi:hypothetical protein
MKSHFWGRLGLSIIILAAIPLSAATNSGPIDEASLNKAWPALLSAEPIRMDPEVAVLHERANAALNAVLQAPEALE